MRVALHTRVRRHIRPCMSPLTSSSSDKRGLACRDSRGSGATCSRLHVALHELVERHALVGTSHLARIPSDMLALACRPSRARRATCSPWHVALHELVERHARLGMSLRMRVKCDMGRFAVSLLRSSKATFTLLLHSSARRACRGQNRSDKSPRLEALTASAGFSRAALVSSGGMACGVCDAPKK